MTENINFKAIEKRAFQATQQDGLLEIFFGLYLLAMSLTPIINIQAPLRYLPALLVLLVGAGGMRVAKKRVIEPRLGRVKFSRERKKRQVIVKAGTIIFSVVLLILSIWMYTLSEKVTNPGLEKFLDWFPAIVYGFFVFAIFLALHIFLNMPRALLFGGLIGASLTITALLDTYANITFPYAMLVSGAVLLIVGIRVLTIFLRRHDLPAGEDMHDAV